MTQNAPIGQKRYVFPDRYPIAHPFAYGAKNERITASLRLALNRTGYKDADKFILRGFEAGIKPHFLHYIAQKTIETHKGDASLVLDATSDMLLFSKYCFSSRLTVLLLYNAISLTAKESVAYLDILPRTYRELLQYGKPVHILETLFSLSAEGPRINFTAWRLLRMLHEYKFYLPQHALLIFINDLVRTTGHKLSFRLQELEWSLDAVEVLFPDMFKAESLQPKRYIAVNDHCWVENPQMPHQDARLGMLYGLMHKDSVMFMGNMGSLVRAGLSNVEITTLHDGLYHLTEKNREELLGNVSEYVWLGFSQEQIFEFHKLLVARYGKNAAFAAIELNHSINLAKEYLDINNTYDLLSKIVQLYPTSVFSIIYMLLDDHVESKSILSFLEKLEKTPCTHRSSLYRALTILFTNYPMKNLFPDNEAATILEWMNKFLESYMNFTPEEQERLLDLIIKSRINTSFEFMESVYEEVDHMEYIELFLKIIALDRPNRLDILRDIFAAMRHMDLPDGPPDRITIKIWKVTCKQGNQ